IAMGGQVNDTLIGDLDANTFYGGAGIDTLDGKGGVDTLNGGSGDDAINSVDGGPDQVLCGAGASDSATVDPQDTVSECELIPGGVDPVNPDPVDPADPATVRINTLRPRMTRKGIVSVKLTCLSETTRCKGRLTLKTRGKIRVSSTRRKRKRRKLTLGRRSYSIPAGKRRTVRVKVRRQARRVIRRRKRLKVRATAVTDSGVEASSTTTTKRTITVKSPKRKRSRRRR
ncbi:hypothetical protein LCGC14_2961700, partial [marine sediment metagenome]